MNLEYVPLLQVQRDLYKLPRGFERFREYLRTMLRLASHRGPDWRWHWTMPKKSVDIGDFSCYLMVT